jgi:uncharacterized double-CXXCG motif protein
MKHFWLRCVKTPKYLGEYRARHTWYLPGTTCPTCGATWGGIAEAWPCVDLSDLDEQEKFSEARLEEDRTEFERLREKVRPLVPTGAPLRPGTAFGPLTGKARGRFAELVFQDPWLLLLRQEAMEKLHAEGLRGLEGRLADLHFKQKEPPRLVELQLPPKGRMHRDCLLAEFPEPCARCGRWGVKVPEEPILDAATLPEAMDVFRLADFPTVIIGSERFVETVRRLGYQEVDFLELPQR